MANTTDNGALRAANIKLALIVAAVALSFYALMFITLS
jgi:hypothetical protein